MNVTGDAPWPEKNVSFKEEHVQLHSWMATESQRILPHVDHVVKHQDLVRANLEQNVSGPKIQWLQKPSSLSKKIDKQTSKLED